MYQGQSGGPIRGIVHLSETTQLERHHCTVYFSLPGASKYSSGNCVTEVGRSDETQTRREGDRSMSESDLNSLGNVKTNGLAA